MVLIFFFILFNYTVLRDTKDTLIVTGPGSGAEVIPFLKVYGVVPCAIIFMIIYAKLSNKLSKKALFYTSIAPFLFFFGLFATVFYPLRDALHPHAFCDHLQSFLPKGFMGLIAIIRNWTYSLFYVMSELWGSVGVSLLFWGFANDINKVSESKRFYTIFMVFANISLIFSGRFIQWASKIRGSITVGDSWQISLNYMMGIVVLSGLLMMGIYAWMQRYVLSDKRFYDPSEQKVAKKEKPKLSMKDSFLYLIRSKYLGLIAILVFGYGAAINLVEVIWKSQLKIKFQNDPNSYSFFMGEFSEMTGIVTILITFFLSGNVIRKFGWSKSALITPVILLVTGVAFFSFILFQKPLGALVGGGFDFLTLAVTIGMIQNIATKSLKYSFFDPTKEMAYIPLDQEQKVKGKAAVDVVGARLGKSAGSLIQQPLIILLGSSIAATPYIATIFLVIVAAWMSAAKALGKRFVTLSAEKEKEAAAERMQEGAAAPQPS